MIHFENKEGFCHSISLEKLAKEFGTPLFVYSAPLLRERCRDFKSAFADYPTLPFFAIKANSNLTILKEVFAQGIGADVVSVGELERAVMAGAKPENIVFSGVGKREDEIARALEVGILCLNVESMEELPMIQKVALEKNLRAKISLRINPNIDAKTNPYIATGLYTTKFGIAEKSFPKALEICKTLPNLDLVGLSCHLGSQIKTLKPFREAAQRMLLLAKRAMEAGFALKHLDLGGGLAISYQQEKVPSFTDYAKVLMKEMKSSGLTLLLEPGRCLVGPTGVLLTKVLHVKEGAKKTFVIVDGAMSELIRPALYSAHHEILPVRQGKASIVADVVGPVCESGDFFGEKRSFPKLKSGDLLFIRDTGAYGMSMASHYNSRPNPAEILVDTKTYRVIRRRERLDALWSLELS